MNLNQIGSILDTKLTHGHLMSGNNQQSECASAVCGKQKIIIKYYLQDGQQNNNIHGNIKTLKILYLERC